jgi:hypothetical protein
METWSSLLWFGCAEVVHVPVSDFMYLALPTVLDITKLGLEAMLGSSLA